ncbi:uncharacterized protein [Lolium perenne]|uniref:uncharacterized protein n=1 Tax=Lolium perenne TaxID=4522 RepID=UPI0021F67E33|nr:uncharacterized protein LOC127298674 [Lolium perenne]
MHSGGTMNGKRKSVGGVGPSESEQSTLKVNPEAPGWIKWVRVGAHATERSPCPNRVGTLEKMIRSYPERRGDHVLEPSLGMTFDSLGEAYDFYNLYSWEHGFGVRYGKSRLNPQRTKTMQEIVCGCSGKPEGENTRSCRCECPALIRLLVPPGCAMNLFVRHYMRLQHDREKDEGYQEKRTKVASAVLHANLSIEEHASKVYT